MLLRCLLAAACLAACGGAQTSSFSGDPNRSIGLGEWCRAMADVTCDRMGQCSAAGRDANDACVRQTVTSCLGGHEDYAASGHDGAQLKACADTLQAASCDGYSSTVASHEECQPQSASNSD
jgi:hypothetical protein